MFKTRIASGYLAASMAWASVLVSLPALFAPLDANAIPLFARQTGQNCVSCHAGGQFPELTPYGRMFKLTGYTIGERTLPLSMMAVASVTSTKNTNDLDQGGNPRADFPKDGNLALPTASVFLGGKITDNIGAFAQFSLDNYSSQAGTDSHWQSHGSSDNLDVRFADRFIDPKGDLVFGLTVNNNPTVQDAFNTVPAWMFPYQTGLGAIQPPIDPKVGSLGQNVGGLGAYAYWNRTVYAELSAYRAADRGPWALMSRGISSGNMTMVKGWNPYWRLALTHEWGPNNIMVGAFGMNTTQFNDPEVRDPSDVDKFSDLGWDAQYQYLLDPHTITAQLSYIREKIHYGTSHNSANGSSFFDATGTVSQPNFNDYDTQSFLRTKLTYVYRAKYGASLGYFDVKGSVNSLNQTVGFDDTGTLVQPGGPTGNLSGKPDTIGTIQEIFWTPVQYIRVGLQYTAYNKFNGQGSNYDGFGRNAKDNNALFFYVWGAY